MYNSSGLIPARFLILISHFIISVTLLWNKEETAKACLSEETSLLDPILDNYHIQWAIGLSLMISFLVFELLVFIFGFTMFNNNSALISIGGHSLACVFLTGLALHGWQCGWFWWIFSFGSALPFTFDLMQLLEGISIERPGWSTILILAGVTTTLGLSLPVGYNIGVVNTPAEIMKLFCREAILQRYSSNPGTKQLDLIWASIVAIFLVGAAAGSLGGSVLADKIGRKGVIIVCSVLGGLSAICFIAAKPLTSIELLFLGRLIVGLCSGLTTSVVPMYLTELAPLHLRGSTGVLCPLGVTIGVLLGQVISMKDILGNVNYWPYCLAAYAIPLIVCALSLPILPESPKYLFVIKNQHHKAFQQLKKLRNISEDSLSIELEALKKEQDNNRNVGTSWNIGKVISTPSLLLPLLLVCALQAGQQLSGINAVFFYSSTIFRQAGLSDKESELATVGSGLCNCFMAIVSIWTMSAFNRRFCILVSTATSAVFLILLGISIMYIDSYTWVPYFSIVGVLGFVLCYGFGLGPIPYFVGSELFEVGPRPSAMALGSMSNWGGNFVIGLAFPSMQFYIGPSSFFIFAAIVLGLFSFVQFYLPETRGRDIREIVELCKHGLSSKPRRKQIPVPAETQKMYNAGGI